MSHIINYLLGPPQTLMNLSRKLEKLIETIQAHSENNNNSVFVKF